MHIREKPHQANLNKQEPKDNHKGIWNLFEQTCHIGIREFITSNLSGKPQMFTFLWDYNMHIAYYSPIM